MTPYLIAARQPLALLVLLAAVATGLTVGIWLLPLGIVVYLAMVALAGRDPELLQQAQRSQQRAQISSVTFRTIIGEIDRSSRAVQGSIDQTGGPLNGLLQSVRAQSDALVEQAHELALKGQIIEQYLTASNPAQLQMQINQLDDRIRQTTDGYTIQQLQATRQALVNRQTNARDLETYVGRIIAQLQNIDANLDNVLAEVVRLRTADAVSADSTTNQVAQQLNDLNADMTTFRQVLDTALSGAGA